MNSFFPLIAWLLSWSEQQWLKTDGCLMTPLVFMLPLYDLSLSTFWEAIYYLKVQDLFISSLIFPLSILSTHTAHNRYLKDMQFIWFTVFTLSFNKYTVMLLGFFFSFVSLQPNPSNKLAIIHILGLLSNLFTTLDITKQVEESGEGVPPVKSSPPQTGPNPVSTNDLSHLKICDGVCGYQCFNGAWYMSFRSFWYCMGNFLLYCLYFI